MLTWLSNIEAQIDIYQDFLNSFNKNFKTVYKYTIQHKDIIGKKAKVSFTEPPEL